MEPRPIGFDVANAGVEGELQSYLDYIALSFCLLFFFLQICTEMIDAFNIQTH